MENNTDNQGRYIQQEGDVFFPFGCQIVKVADHQIIHQADTPEDALFLVSRFNEAVREVEARKNP